MSNPSNTENLQEFPPAAPGIPQPLPPVPEVNPPPHDAEGATYQTQGLPEHFPADPPVDWARIGNQILLGAIRLASALSTASGKALIYAGKAGDAYAARIDAKLKGTLA